MIQLPDLPYALDALEPHISRETLAIHHGRHHRGYVRKLNAQIDGTSLAGLPLETIVREVSGSGGIFNNAAQAWNHGFYWRCLSPDGGGRPEGALLEAIEASFGSFEAFREQFTQEALGTFGSGWAWLVQRPSGALALTRTSNAGTPLVGEDAPLLTCDVWEHAYYIDRRDDRAAYIEAFWSVVNWDFVAGQLDGQR